MPNCQSCGAPIRWAKTVSGRRIPLDPQPTASGNVLLLDGVATAVALVDQTAEAPLYVSHFATCHQASAWRGAKR